MPEIAARTELLLGEVGGGKTETALERVLTTLRERPFGQVWVLLPTERQSYNFRQRLLNRAHGSATFFNLRFFNFYSLNAYILDSVGQPQQRLEEGARFRLLRSVIHEVNSEPPGLQAFSAIAHTAGFARIVAAFIDELKQNLVAPALFAQAAQSAKDRDLARIYAAYQDVLQQHRLVDHEGEGWVALSAAQAQSVVGHNIDLLVADGFDQFTIIQAHLLTLLASRARQAIVTLSHVPGREAVVGKRFRQALDRLQVAHNMHGVELQRKRIEPGNTRRDVRLTSLAACVFRPNVKQRVDDTVRFIEAPDPAIETAAVLRQVKRRLLEGCRPDDLLVTVRDWDRYGRHLARVGQAYGLPLALQHSESLAENPAVNAVLEILQLADSFNRQPLLDVLRSPYIEIPALSGEWVDLLDRVSRVMRVTGGREHWLRAIEDAAHLTRTENQDADEDNDDSEPLLFPDAADHLARHLSLWFDRLTPPSEATVAFYIDWIEKLVGRDPERDPDDDDDLVSEDVASLNVIAKVRAPAPGGIVDRDLAAMAVFKHVLRSLLASQNLFEALALDSRVSWKQFLAQLREAVGRAVVQRSPGRAGRVLVTTVTDARGLPHDHVFVLGLAEGVFPAHVGEDPLYLDGERAALNERGLSLPDRGSRRDDDGLFYEIINQAQQSLTLSRSYIKDGAAWPASHLWRAVIQAVDSEPMIMRLPIGAVVPPDEVTSLPEAALAVADGLSTNALSPGVAPLYNWLVAEHGDHWGRVQLARAIEASRMSDHHPYDRYTGRLSGAGLVAQVAREAFHPRREWSASELNDYGICGFRYFARRLLKLEPLEAPEDTMTALHVGTLYHEILEETYRRIMEEAMPITPDNVDQALSILHAVADEVLPFAPARLGFQTPALWVQEQVVLLRHLETLIRKDFSVQSPFSRFDEAERSPYGLELAFGRDIGREVAIEIGDGPTLRVRGKIDRIDRIGDRAVVVDYKSGSADIKADELVRGRNFQMMVYILAAQQLLNQNDHPLHVSGGIFWHIRSGRVLGDLKTDEQGLEALERGRNHIARYMEYGRQGNFAAHANRVEEGRCVHYCEFGKLCRAAVVSRAKPRD